MSSRYEHHDNVNFRCLYDVTTSSLRFFNDPTTIISHSRRAYSATLLRLSRSFYVHHILTTIIPRVIRLHHDLTTLLLRLYHVLTTIILRSYRDLTTVSAITSCSILIQFHSFNFWLIRWFLGNHPVMPPKFTRTRGRVGRGWCRGRGRGSSDSIKSCLSRDVEDRPIQPKFQPIAGP